MERGTTSGGSARRRPDASTEGSRDREETDERMATWASAARAPGARGSGLVSTVLVLSCSSPHTQKTNRKSSASARHEQGERATRKSKEK